MDFRARKVPCVPCELPRSGKDAAQEDTACIQEAAEQAGCSGDMRTGLRLLLVGRAGQAQKQGALQAAAMFAQLSASPAWLLGSSGPSTKVAPAH